MTLPTDKQHSPVWLSVEDCAGGMDVDHLLVHEGPVSFLRVLLGSVTEEPAEDGLLHAPGVTAAGYDVQLVSGRKRMVEHYENSF